MSLDKLNQNTKDTKKVPPIRQNLTKKVATTGIFVAVGLVLSYVNYFAYAAGFASGNLVGMIIEEKLALGIQMIRVFSHADEPDLVNILNSNGFGATSIEAHGAKEKIHLIYTIVHRNELGKVLEIINNFSPHAFYTIEDVKLVNEGIFPSKKTGTGLHLANVMRRWRKGK